MSVISLAEAALERIEAQESALHAYAFLDRDAVLAEARRLDSEQTDGPLTGHVVAIKDIFATADMPTGCGSAIYTGHRPVRDAAAVAAIRAAGGLIVGKSVTTEFAHMTPGPTRNPHDHTRTPGGSSSGSAATIAAAAATLATGTQTAGSIIRPAAFCGVVGYKPSFGMISRSGLSMFGETLDTIGGFAQSVADAARFIGVMADRADLIEPRRAGPPKLALWRTPDADQAQDAAVAELERVAEAAARAGATVIEFGGWSGWDSLQSAHATIMAYEGARALAFERCAHSEQLSPSLRSFLEAGAMIDGLAYLDARRTSLAEGALFLDALSDCDALLTLSSHGEAPLVETGTGNAHFNRVWTLIGGPALHLPTGRGPAGLPVGVQLFSAPQDDARLVSSALWLEGALQ